MSNESRVVSRRRICRFALLVSMLLIACTDADVPPAVSRCERYRDHAIDLRLESRESTLTPADVEAHRRQLRDAVGSALIAECEGGPEARVACALSAETEDRLRACVSP
jgi:hypothetical protein